MKKKSNWITQLDILSINYSWYLWSRFELSKLADIIKWTIFPGHKLTLSAESSGSKLEFHNWNLYNCDIYVHLFKLQRHLHEPNGNVNGIKDMKPTLKKNNYLKVTNRTMLITIFRHTLNDIGRNFTRNFRTAFCQCWQIFCIYTSTAVVWLQWTQDFVYYPFVLIQKSFKIFSQYLNFERNAQITHVCSSSWSDNR